VALLHIQFDEGIVITMDAKVLRTVMNVQPVKMNFRYRLSLGVLLPVTHQSGMWGPREACELTAKGKPR
jgi:hypothetical protein